MIFKSEQTLIDTMLTADLIVFAQRDYKHLCVIGSDDDFWPGIRTALHCGANSVQVHTSTTRSAADYASGVGAQYRQTQL